MDSLNISNEIISKIGKVTLHKILPNENVIENEIKNDIKNEIKNEEKKNNKIKFTKAKNRKIVK